MIDLIAAVIWLGVAVSHIVSRQSVPWWIHVLTCILLAAFHLNKGYFGNG
jgi:hypothetical protein